MYSSESGSMEINFILGLKKKSQLRMNNVPLFQSSVTHFHHIVRSMIASSKD